MIETRNHTHRKNPNRMSDAEIIVDFLYMN